MSQGVKGQHPEEPLSVTKLGIEKKTTFSPQGLRRVHTASNGHCLQHIQTVATTPFLQSPGPVEGSQLCDLGWVTQLLCAQFPHLQNKVDDGAHLTGVS